MDLHFHGHAELAAQCLNRYLEYTGDYDGLRVLQFYKIMRALVRSKVAMLRAAQSGVQDQCAASTKQGLAYLALAVRLLPPIQSAIMLTHGYSGSGKTSFSRIASQTVGAMGAIHLRSDVERKRIHSLRPEDHSGVYSIPDIYGARASEETYKHLLRLARTIAYAGWPVIIDAAFLQRWQRDIFAMLADELRIPFFIFDIHTSAAIMRARIATRSDSGNDASDATIAILEQQLALAEPLSLKERSRRIVVDMECGITRASAA
jgi:predicted kinase